MKSPKAVAILRGVLAACVAMLAAAAWIVIEGRPDGVEPFTNAAAVRSEVGGPFEMVDHRGTTVTDADFHGQHLLVFFGYTYCPDVCPTVLATMAAALDLLGPAAELVTPIFVTIDPARDTTEAMADYVALFHPKIVGLTGTARQLANMAKSYQAFYAKGPGDGGDYLMEHTGVLYLMGPEGEYLGVLPPGVSPDEMAAALRTQLDG